MPSAVFHDRFAMIRVADIVAKLSCANGFAMLRDLGNVTTFKSDTLSHMSPERWRWQPPRAKKDGSFCQHQLYGSAYHQTRYQRNCRLAFFTDSGKAKHAILQFWTRQDQTSGAVEVWAAHVDRQKPKCLWLRGPRANVTHPLYLSAEQHSTK